MRRLLRVLAALLALVLLGSVAAAFWARAQLRASLPLLDGEHAVQGLSAPITIERDALGIPTVRGATRADVARATGFVHAQDRFFQMDLARRRASGELAALVGPVAVEADREIRIHRFRAVAERALSLTSARDRAVLDAYAAGVNAGLGALGAPPFEYLLLRQDPRPWTPVDSLLVVLSMFITLQDDDGSYESTLATMHDVLPAEMAAFLAPPGSGWDAPLIGAPHEVPPVPGPEVYDLRSRADRLPPPRRPNSSSDETRNETQEAAIGSNNFAVAGHLTHDGGALVANDMHLTIRVPNIWYRAVLEWPGESAADEPHVLAGVTLPGVPAMVAGSNMHVAWGFTNTYGDWSDIVLLDTDTARPGEYLTPQGWLPFERFDEVIEIAGEAAQRMQVEWTIWGPRLAPDHKGRARAYRWVAHATEQLATSITPLESARTVEEAFDVANGLGAPGQNFVVADRSGRIGWTVYGSIPRRVGLDGRLPASWSDGSRGWDGWLHDEEYPRIADPASGRIWTANARVVDGDMLALIGDGSYDIGSRAHMIRNRLAAREAFTPRDLLEIQLDTGADFLVRWRELILRTLSPDAVAGDERRAAFRQVVERDWSGEADPESAGYRLTREFRDVLSAEVVAFVLAECYGADESFNYTAVRRREAAIWRLVTERPQHLLHPQYASWTELVVAAIDTTIEEALRDRAGTLQDRVWSEYNETAYRHPLSGALPLLYRWLDMPDRPLPGDLYTPRVHWRAVAASQRMVVSPGREAEGIMHMPTGQSGHPLSPYYANSHPAWVAGEPSPFLPGPAQHVLRLIP